MKRVLSHIKSLNIILAVILILFTFSGCNFNFGSSYIDPETGELIGKPANISLLKKSSVKTINSTSNNVFFLMNSGDLLATGDNTYGVLGQGDTQSYDYAVAVKIDERIKLIEATQRRAVAVSDTNAVYVWGDLSWWGITEQTAIDEEGNTQLAYKKFEFEKGEIICDVSISENHIAVLSKSANVYTLGYNNGQLGYDFDKASQNIFYPNFRKIEYSMYFTAIASNATATYMLTIDGELYGCSQNKNYELGYMDILANINRIESNAMFIDITTAGRNVFALTNDGDVYVCGTNTNGVFGFNSSLSYAAALTQVPFENGKIVQVCGNDDFSFVHYVTDEGKVFACGDNSNKALYTSSVYSTVTVPTLVNIGTVSLFFGTGTAKFYVDTSDRLYTYGTNSYAQMPDIESSKTNTFIYPTRIYAEVK